MMILKHGYFPALPVLLWLAGAALSTDAAMLPGAEAKEWPADPTRHVVTMERASKDEEDAKWIAAAERAPVDAELLRKEVLKQDENAAVAEGQWWYQEAVAVKIPFALTAEAVTYYSDLVTGYGKQKMKRYSQPGSSFQYKAKVTRHEKLTHNGTPLVDVTVVTLEAEFSQNFCATVTEAMSFSKQRTVIFDKNGKVLHISGDGETEARIMAI
jgi:hypothetical protein